MEQNFSTLETICREQVVEPMDLLSCPVKNKLIEVSNYVVKKGIGNTALARKILGNLDLQDIYLNRNQRINLASNLKRSLKIIQDIEEGKQCKDELVKYINFKKYLSAGSFGEVSIGNMIPIRGVSEENIYKKFDFAIKMAQLPKQVIPDMEVHIARLLNNLVFQGIAQNLPLIIDSFKCDSCMFKNITIPSKKGMKCLFMINEIANGDMINWLSTNPPARELESCLFQLMAGIHAFQHHYLLFNNDIKAQNILFYNVNPGGYWKYTIHGRDFYVPNYGKLFIINDFGVSTIYAPKYQLEYGSKKDIDLGGRVFMINNNKFDPIENVASKKGSIISIINWDNGSSTNYTRILFNQKTKKINLPPILSKAQKKILPINPEKLDFYNSNLVPPLELMSDTQDIMRIFTGQIRMTQSIGMHQKFGNIDRNFKLSLQKYILESGMSFLSLLVNNYITQSTDLSRMLAGHFIVDYFTKVVDYTIPQDKDLIISHTRTS
jgi:hypothetical protein